MPPPLLHPVRLQSPRQQRAVAEAREAQGVDAAAPGPAVSVDTCNEQYLDRVQQSLELHGDQLG